MQVRIREESIEIDGYVNAIERKSKTLRSRIGKFVERIKKGAFRRAIERNGNVLLLLNHDRDRVLGGTGDGTLELREDAIGLHAHAVVTDAETVQKAREGKLRGWSFGFNDVPDGVDQKFEDGMLLREVKDMDLREVSILDDRKYPAYEGTLIMARSDEEVELYGETFDDEVITREETRDKPEEKPEEQPEEKPVIDYSKYNQIIKEMKGE